MLRKFLTFLLVSVLVVAPCAGANASLNLGAADGIVTKGDATVVSDHQHSLATEPDDHSHHSSSDNDPTDCLWSCDPAVSFLAQQRDGSDVAILLPVAAPVGYDGVSTSLPPLLAAALLHASIVKPGSVVVPPAMTVLRRTSRLRF